MLNKRSWKERLRGDVRITLPERPEIVGGYASCERFLPEERRPVRAWMAAGAVCAAVLIVLVANVWRMLPAEQRQSGGRATMPLAPTTAATAQTPFFCAVVLEKLNSSYMVRPEADFKYAGERVHISAPKDAPVFEAGDRITVYYDGRIMESYPPQVNALRIEAGHIRTTRQSAPAS